MDSSVEDDGSIVESIVEPIERNFNLAAHFASIKSS
jgi:hypothetical protein